MSKKDKNEVLHHEYDGIQEYDNPLPNWWLATFYGAILFSVIYVAYYHFGPGPSLDDELAQDMAAVSRIREVSKGALPAQSEENLLAVFNDSAKRRKGQEQFSGKCASCHGALGEGLIGPNLTDKFWIHGDGSLLGIFHAVADGVPDKGMPPWKGMLKKDELENVVAFVAGLKESNPANPKAPQGNEVK